MNNISQNRHRKSLEYALKVLFNEKYNKYIKSIYLYGSCARVEQKYNSDVDIFIFIEKNMSRKMYNELKNDMFIEEEDLPEIDVRCSKSNKFSDVNSFNRNLEREAELLWKRN